VYKFSQEKKATQHSSVRESLDEAAGCHAALLYSSMRVSPDVSSHVTGAQAEAWCLLIHADASLSISPRMGSLHAGVLQLHTSMCVSPDVSSRGVFRREVEVAVEVVHAAARA